MLENISKEIEQLRNELSSMTQQHQEPDNLINELKTCLSEIDASCPAAAMTTFRSKHVQGNLQVPGSTSSAMPTSSLMLPLVMPVIAPVVASSPRPGGSGSPRSAVKPPLDRTPSVFDKFLPPPVEVSVETKEEGLGDTNTSNNAQGEISEAAAAAANAALAQQAAQYQALLLDLQQRLQTLSEEKEDSEYALHTRIAELEAQKAELDARMEELSATKAEVETRLENVLKVKRTDLIKKYEDEMAALRANVTGTVELIAQLQADKKKQEVKIKELSERADKAEEELSQRDAQEQRALNPQEEKYILKQKVTKQRDEIVMKSKAATAGWDAAADAEEKLEVAVEKAYDKGLQEGRKANKADLAAMHAALEVKENRATELLEQTAALNRRIVELEKREKDLLVQLEEANTRVTLVPLRGGGDDDDDGGLASSLDAAEEQIIALNEKIEYLNDALRVSEKKIALYKQLAAAREGISQPQSAPYLTGDKAGAPPELSVADRKLKMEMEEQIRIFKGVISQVGIQGLDHACIITLVLVDVK